MTDITRHDIETAIRRDILNPNDECSQCGQVIGHLPEDRGRTFFYASDYGNYCSKRCATAHEDFCHDQA